MILVFGNKYNLWTVYWIWDIYVLWLLLQKQPFHILSVNVTKAYNSEKTMEHLNVRMCMYVYVCVCVNHNMTTWIYNLFINKSM
jgi:hypothetical protein